MLKQSVTKFGCLKVDNVGDTAMNANDSSDMGL